MSIYTYLTRKELNLGQLVSVFLGAGATVAIFFGLLWFQGLTKPDEINVASDGLVIPSTPRSGSTRQVIPPPPDPLRELAGEAPSGSPPPGP